MDWNLFWNAFGAIGTTIGSLITAIAVIVALMQYKQPLLKKISVEFTSAIADIGNDAKPYYMISIQNKGIRECNISSLYVLGSKYKLYLNFSQVNSPYTMKKFPFELKEEQRVDLFFDMKKFKEEMRNLYKDGYISNKGKLIICVVDTAGDEYKGKTRIKLRRFLK